MQSLPVYTIKQFWARLAGSLLIVLLLLCIIALTRGHIKARARVQKDYIVQQAAKCA